MPLARLEQHLASRYAASRVFTPETIKKAKVATGVTLAYVVHTSDGDTTDADTEVRVVLVTGYCNRQEEWAPTVDAMLTQWSVERTGKRLKVLTLDNRGVGNSDAPWGAYSTATLADDTLALADHLGWPTFHLVGASMGGMICQKMCLAAPDRIESLALLATARGTVLPGSQAYPALFKMMTAASAHRQVDGMLSFLYPSSFLDQPNGDSGSTMRDVMTSYHTQVSVANAKPSVAGALGQTAAVTRHYVSDAELHRMRDTGYPILIVGTRLDLCISVEHAYELADALASDHTELFVFEDAGHGALLQHVDATVEKLLALFLRAKQGD